MSAEIDWRSGYGMWCYTHDQHLDDCDHAAASPVSVEGGEGQFVREGKPDAVIKPHVRKVQAELRESDYPPCGAVFDEPGQGEVLCLRDPGHPLPHGGRSPVSERDCERCEGGGNYSELAPCTTFTTDCACNGPRVLVDPCPDCGGSGLAADPSPPTGKDER